MTTILGILLLAGWQAGADTLRLDELQAAAEARDPRARRAALLEEATELRLEDLAVEWLPRLSVRGEATHQSEVTSLPVALPGTEVPEPPKDRYQATLDAEQLVYDGGVVARRRAVERARLEEQRAELRAELYALRQEVTEAFFGAYLLQARVAEIDALLGDLEARLALVRARVREGAALPGDAAAVEAELLRAEQARAEAAAGRGAAVAVLRELTGVAAGPGDVLALPDAGAAVERVLAAGVGEVRGRPEYAAFAGARARLAEEGALLSVERRPRVVAFGQAGYGRPGLDQFRQEPGEFWLAGVRVEWSPWDWGGERRRRELVEVQGEVVAAEEAAFTARLERAVEADRAAMSRLAAALEADDRIVELREQIERQARARLDEGVLTAAEYVERRTDVVEARLARERHRAELAQARARFLTTVGVAPRGAGGEGEP